MQDNSERGKRVIFWTRLFYVASVLCNIVLVAFAVGRLYANSGSIEQVQFKLLGLFIVLLLMFLAGGVIACIYIVNWVLWLYGEEKNIRKLGKSGFSPFGAALLSSIPLIGRLIDYWIFRDILARQEAALRSYGKEPSPIPRRELVIFLVSSFALVVFHAMLDVWWGYAVIAAIFCVIARYLLVVMERIVEQGGMLYRLHEEFVLRAKVDEVLREREIEKAAREVQAARYDEPPPSP